MRNWTVTFFFLASCSFVPPTKLAEVPGKEIYWMYAHGRLMRCWHEEVPICMPAAVVPNPREFQQVVSAEEMTERAARGKAQAKAEGRARADQRKAAEAQFIIEMNRRFEAEGKPLYTGDPFLVPDELQAYRRKVAAEEAAGVPAGATGFKPAE